LGILDFVKVRGLEDSAGNEGALSMWTMWYGYAIEAIYTVLGTVLVASVIGILIYHWSSVRVGAAIATPALSYEKGTRNHLDGILRRRVTIGVFVDFGGRE
jgi:hypothetical protein